MIDASLLILGVGALAIVGVILLVLLILRQDAGTSRMKEIAGFIESGANAYFTRQLKTIGLIVPWLAAAIFLFFGWKTSLTFIAGVSLSLAAGFVGMKIALKSNVRTANLALKSTVGAFRVAFLGGSVTGLSVTALSLLAIYGLHALMGELQPLIGFGIGGSLAALFAQIGGGIYTKSADIGADLVGKLEKKIPEDDPRNPAVIADLVGDNVGDCAGRGSDLFQSFSDDMITGMILGLMFIWKYGPSVVIFPIMMQALGIIASLIGILIVIKWSTLSPSASILMGLTFTSMVNAIGLYFLSTLILNDFSIFLSSLCGMVAMLLTIFVVEYYTSPSRSLIKKMAEIAEAGAAVNVIAGLAYGFQSSIIPILVTIGAIVFSFTISGGSIFAIVAANIGTDLLTTFIMSTDAFGPITDNAEGIAKMSGISGQAIAALEKLDAVGNTMKASTKAYTMASGTITALVTFLTFFKMAGISFLDMNAPFPIAALLLGMALSYFFSSLMMSATSRGALKMVDEVRRQFRQIHGLNNGGAIPDYAKCIDIATTNSLKEIVLPASLVFLGPIIVGVTFGAEELGTLVVGAAISSALLGFFFNNTGAIYDNEKKFIESGFHGGAGSRAHRATVVADLIGDSLKDVVGPSLIIFMKLLSMIALLLVPLLR